MDTKKFQEIVKTEEIHQKAIEAGFDLVGFTGAKIPRIDKENILQWVEKNLYGDMDWYPRNQELRLEFKNLGFTPESVIALGIVYNDENYEREMNKFPVKISRYSVGKDYHTVLKEKGTILIKYLKENYPDHHFRQGVDSLPVPEKILSRQAGIGWIGKNTNLINENLGSYFFLAVILTDLNLKEDSPAKDRCGTCRACLDACPTGALFDEYKIDAGKCISYFTIETKKEDLTQEKENFKSWVYGCDICQEVCPWNSVKARKNKVYTKEKDFTVKDFFKRLEPESILNLSENEFNKLKDESAMERISYSNYKRNINKYFKDL